ncbi:MAG: helix-turn-helix domain-containing protein [Yoonia sp.]|uniref:GlxA family transcriptional regulator n=1 Tax=Yoonia sp. TaxID=2212373 RepID=UPI00326781B8
MAPTTPSAAAQQPIVCDIIVAGGYVLTELAGVVDVLRLANRISNREVFQWTYRSASGGYISSSSDAVVDTVSLHQRSAADYAFVLGNADANHPALSLGAVLSGYTTRQARVILLSEAASRYIADKREDGAKHTTHWENRAVLLERLGLFDTKSALAVDAGAIVTCAGMGATVDVTLSIAAQHLSSATMMTVADILLHERIRHFNTLQPFAGRAALATGDADLDTCVSLMQANIEFPLPIAKIADQTGVSKRSLERKFHSVLRTTPNGYYRELRLGKANNLLLNTDMSINEIGLACGFPSGFSAIYKATFGMTPNAARRKGRTK